MTDDVLAIQVVGLGKMYRIYDQPVDRLKQMLWGRYRKQGYGREFWALRGISFDIRAGECVGIVGRNGSGKSTLLQMICGTMSPTEGTVRTSGRIAALLELGSGFNPDFTGRQNVYLNGSILGLTQRQIDERFESIAAFADIGDFLEQPVRTYSSGMSVRLAFALIAHVDADILVIDEALSVGDAYFVQKCMRVIRKFIETKTVLFVSHDTGAILNLCNRAVLIESGQIKLAGTPKSVVEQYLQDMHIAEHGRGEGKTALREAALEKVAECEFRDVRADLLNASNLRNDLEVFRFSPESTSFGLGLMRIESVVLTDEHGLALAWTVGGEVVRLIISCLAKEAIDRPIVGFTFKDRLGQYIFGDNTYLTFRDNPQRIPKNGRFQAIFEFLMPVLPVGDYSFAIAVAEGTQENHVQHHWIHDALIIKSHASSIVFGLIGIPMRKIKLVTQ